MGFVGRNLFLIALSIVYLTFELAFNARLLDVVGGGASTEEVHAIEVYGRTLSGIALALWIFGLQWKKRAESGGQGRSWGAIALWFVFNVGVVYIALQLIVDGLVHVSGDEYRRTSLNIVLLQDALVEGKAELEGLTERPDLFASPEGKAFLALFPAMAVSVDRLDEKISDAKLTLIERKLRQEVGGVSGFHDRYQDGVDEIRRKFTDYQKLPTARTIDVDAEVAKQQDKAWEDYLRDLGKRGWTPSTVPSAAESRVVQQVRRQVPVPRDWKPADEAGFRAAVASQTRSRLGRLPGADGISVGGRKIPSGLAWAAFFAHEGVQTELRRRLELPPGPRLLPAYDTAGAFDQAVLRPFVKERAAREMQRYEAPAASFGPGGENEATGLDAARAVIVPPVALLFSLLGATMHLCKVSFLLYLLVRAKAAASRYDDIAGQGTRIAGVLLVAVLVTLRLMENDVTRSPLYVYMQRQLLDEPAVGQPPSLWQVTSRGISLGTSHAMHIVAVGQAYTYPFNETIRTRVLGGLSYGYHPSRR